MKLFSTSMMGIRCIVLAVICLSQLYVINAITTIEHTKREFPNKELIFRAESVKDHINIWASCTKNKESKERECKIVRGNVLDSEDKKICDIKIKLENRKEGSDMDMDQMKIFPLGENKAVLYLIDLAKDGFVQFNTIDLDSCKVTNYEMSLVDLSNPEDNMIFVTADDAFEVYAYNHEAAKKHYVVKFGADGVKEDRPLKPSEAETFSSEVSRIVPVSGSLKKGIVYEEYKKNGKFDFKLRKPDGSDVPLTKQVVYEPSFLSTNNDLIGICFKLENDAPKFNCTQYDMDGVEKFNINPLKDDGKAAIVGVHNLAEGGMLIVVGSCKSEICSFYEIDFSVIKVDLSGATVGTANIGKVAAVSDSNDVEMALSFQPDKDKNECVSIANYEGIGTGRRSGGLLGGLTYCLVDADFTK